ncbi:MAG: DUF2726 domain-containing protein [Phycisphaerales bacterium]
MPLSLASLWLILVVILVLAVALLLVALLKQKSGRTSADAEPDAPASADAPYRLVDGVLSAGERKFYPALSQSVASLARELGRPMPLLLLKVRLADVVTVDNKKLDGDRSRWASARNRIERKHTDFLLCHPEATSPLLAIELDDRSHQHRDDRKARDRFVDAASAAAGLPIIHIPAAAAYDPRALTDTLRTALGLAAARP